MEEISREKRAYYRTEMLIPVVIKIKEGDGTREINATTKDISATGVLVELEENLSPGQEIELELSPEQAPNPIHIVARIARSSKIEGQDKFSTGIEFTKIEEDNKNTLLKFLCDTIYKLS